MIVVDTNIIAYRFIEGDKTDKVIKFQQHDPDWGVPFLWQFEFSNVLSTFVNITNGDEVIISSYSPAPTEELIPCSSFNGIMLSSQFN